MSTVKTNKNTTSGNNKQRQNRLKGPRTLSSHFPGSVVRGRCRSSEQDTRGGWRKKLPHTGSLYLHKLQTGKVACKTMGLELPVVCQDGGDKMRGLKVTVKVEVHASAVGTPGRTVAPRLQR